jgi:hypothetical protein
MSLAARDTAAIRRPASAPPRACDSIIAGSLLGDVQGVARELCRALQHAPIVVWMDANADVLYRSAEAAPVDVAPEWIAGTYGLGASLADIADDLRLLKAERRACGLIED